MQCFRCGAWGHVANVCPTAPRGQQGAGANVHHGAQNMQFSLAHPAGNINKNWLLLDSASTISSVCNLDMITDIRETDEPARVVTNGGSQYYDEVGTLDLVPMDVYVNVKSLANILSLHEVTEKYRVTFDSTKSNCMWVHVGNGNVLGFQSCGKGLYYHDTSNPIKAPAGRRVLIP